VEVLRVALRNWQTEALRLYRDTRPADFLVVATPGAGKTTMALQAAVHLFRTGQVSQLVVVTPTEHLKGQWADAAAELGLPIDPQFSNADGRTRRARRRCGRSRHPGGAGRGAPRRG
jgi:superfamily II DNA or RNA helicase